MERPGWTKRSVKGAPVSPTEIVASLRASDCMSWSVVKRKAVSRQQVRVLSVMGPAWALRFGVTGIDMIQWADQQNPVPSGGGRRERSDSQIALET